MPNKLLTILHRELPGARLCASIKSLDQALLRSPQLYRLDISLPHSDIAPRVSRPLWKQLKDILLLSHNLRILSIDVRPELSVGPLPGKISANLQCQHVAQPSVLQQDSASSSTSQNCDGEGNVSASSTPVLHTVQLPLAPGDMLPPLENLEIRAKTYDLDSTHCSQLLNSINCKKIKYLKMGPTNTETFFEMFHRKLPHLESLDFTYYSPRDNYHDPFPVSGPVSARCAKFVSAIIALKKLVVRCGFIAVRDPFWSSLKDESQWENLRHLSVLPLYEGQDPPQWIGNFASLLVQLSNLTTLEIAMGTQFPNDATCACFPTQTHSLVSRVRVCILHELTTAEYKLHQ